jgi:hypothetical protein
LKSLSSISNNAGVVISVEAEEALT